MRTCFAESLSDYIQEQFYSMKPLTKNLAINTFSKYLDKIGIIPGIKVDTGAKEFSCH